MRQWLCFVFTLTLVGPAWAALQTEEIIYKHGNTNLQGSLVYDDALQGKRPGVIVVHEWWGLNTYPRKRAEQLASLGYVAFALDMYGKGATTTDPKEASKLSTVFKSDRLLMRGRANAGFKILKNHKLVDDRRMAAIGYCFGGTVALEMARAGLPLVGVVSFHGGLDTPEPKDARSIKGNVLVFHGADDPYVPAAQLKEFEEEMRQAKVDWQLNSYGGAVHGFTNPDNGKDNSKGAAYNERADRRSWDAMKLFLAETFK